MTQRLDTNFDLPVETDEPLRRALEDIFARLVRQINTGGAMDVETITGATVVSKEVTLVDASATGTVVCTLQPAKQWQDRVAYVRSLTGVSLLVPQSGETLDGTATVTVASAASTAIISDGANWHSMSSMAPVVAQGGWNKLEEKATTAATSVVFLLTAGIDHRFQISGVYSTTNDGFLSAQLSEDEGSAYDSNKFATVAYGANGSAADDNFADATKFYVFPYPESTLTASRALLVDVEVIDHDTVGVDTTLVGRGYSQESGGTQHAASFINYADADVDNAIKFFLEDSGGTNRAFKGDGGVIKHFTRNR